MLPLIGIPPQHQRVLHPDAYDVDVEAGFLERPAEIQAFCICTEDICRAALSHMNSHVAKCSQQKSIELFICHDVVLNGLSIRRFIRDVVRRNGHDEVGLNAIHQESNIICIGAVTADYPVSAQRPYITRLYEWLHGFWSDVAVIVLDVLVMAFGKEIMS